MVSDVRIRLQLVVPRQPNHGNTDTIAHSHVTYANGDSDATADADAVTYADA
jgi:hypothetical protein